VSLGVSGDDTSSLTRHGECTYRRTRKGAHNEVHSDLHRGCADRGGDCARTDGNGRAKPGYDRRQLGRGSDRSDRGSTVVHEPGRHPKRMPVT